MNSPAKSRSEAKIVIERVYRASAKEIWDLWTTKPGFESWWGPQGFRSEVEEIDARVGGMLRYEMIADTPEMVAAMKKMGQASSHRVTCRFSELQPYSRLVLTNVIDFIPGVAVYENKIDVELITVADKVRMVITLEPMHSDEFTQRQQAGFTSQLTKLDPRFA